MITNNNGNTFLLVIFVLFFGCKKNEAIEIYAAAEITVKCLYPKNIIYNEESKYVAVLQRDPDSGFDFISVENLNTNKKSAIKIIDTLGTHITIGNNELAIMSERDLSIYSLDQLRLLRTTQLPQDSLEFIEYKNTLNGAFVFGKRIYIPSLKKVTDAEVGVREIVVYKLDSQVPYRVFNRPDVFFVSWAIDEHMKYFAAISNPDRIICIWDIQTMEMVRSFKIGYFEGPFAFSPDARFLYWGTKDGYVHVLEISSNKISDYEVDWSYQKSAYIIRRFGHDFILVQTKREVQFYDLGSSELIYIWKGGGLLRAVTSDSSSLILFNKSFSMPTKGISPNLTIVELRQY